MVMLMLVVQIRRVIVAVLHGFVAMAMAVFAGHRREVSVQVMAVIMRWACSCSSTSWRCACWCRSVKCR